MSRIKFWHRVAFERQDLRITSRGLLKRGQAELTVSVSSVDLLAEAEGFLRFIVDYLDRAETRITAGQTLNYGYWLVKFEPVKEGLLEVWELDPEGTNFVRGGSLTLGYWRDQHAVCQKYKGTFSPPNPEKLTVVSAGVLEGGPPVQAVRYPWAEPMSGWMIVTDLYDGKIESLIHNHTYHVTASRPDLAKYFALPYGFRFDLTQGEQVWFDPEVAGQPSV